MKALFLKRDLLFGEFRVVNPPVSSRIHKSQFMQVLNDLIGWRSYLNLTFISCYSWMVAYTKEAFTTLSVQKVFSVSSFLSVFSREGQESDAQSRAAWFSSWLRGVLEKRRCVGKERMLQNMLQVGIHGVRSWEKKRWEVWAMKFGACPKLGPVNISQSPWYSRKKVAHAMI